MSVTRYYVGPVDEVVLGLLDGSEVTVARGEPIHVDDADAERLDLTPQIWAKSKSSKAVKQSLAGQPVDPEPDPEPAPEPDPPPAQPAVTDPIEKE